MTDEEAIEIAKDYWRRNRGRCGPIITIPPLPGRSVIDELTVVNLLDYDRPVVSREPSRNYGPGAHGQ